MLESFHNPFFGRISLKIFSDFSVAFYSIFVHMLCDIAEVVREAMGEEGSIEHLFKIMSKFEDSPTLQIVACSALTNLSFDSGQFNLL
jgi:hypothetical protein